MLRIRRQVAIAWLWMAVSLPAGASTAQDEAAPPAENEIRAEALEDELLEWAPDGGAPQDPAPEEQEAEAETGPTPTPEHHFGDRVRPDEWSIKWRNGFRVRRNDKRYDLRLGGLIQFEAAAFHLDSGLGPRASGWATDADLRRARLFVQGVLLDRILFKVDYDLDETEIRDVFVGLRGIPWIGTVKFGYLKEPFSLEQATSSRFNTFLERSLANALAPRRNSGILATNTLFDGRLRWEAGAFFVVDSFQEADNSEIGFDDDWDFVLRLTSAPIYRDNGRQLLLVGLSYARRFANEEAARFTSRPESRLVDALIGTPEIGPVNGIDTVGVELAWVDGPFSMQGEFIRTEVDRGGGLSDYGAWGAYIQASRFLTGEQRHYGRASGKWGRIVPKQELDWSQRQLGAFEIAARLSHLDLTDGDIRGGRQTNVTLGLNWYPLANVRLGLNGIWGHVAGNGNVLIGQTRLQIDF